MSLSQSITDPCEKVGTKIELLHHSNDFEDLTEGVGETQNFFLRVGRPGRLYLQPNYTAFTKSSLGSIPSKIEKTLLKTDTNIPLTTSINNSLITNDTKNSSTSTEGFITYKHPKSYTTSYSSKGYGVGFVSKTERFKKGVSAYMPGPGEYSPDKLFTVENEIKKTDLGKSLFLNPASKSLQLIQSGNNTSNSFSNYNNNSRNINNNNNSSMGRNNNLDKSQENDKSNNNNNGNINNLNNSSSSDEIKGNYFFCSNTNRFQGGLFNLKNKNPGPGKYFLETDYKISHPEKLSPGFMNLQPKIISPIKYFGLNTNDHKNMGFKIQDKMKNGKVATFWRGGLPYLGYTYDFGKTLTKLKDKKKIKNKSLDKVITMPDFQSTQELRKNKFLRTNATDLNDSNTNNSRGLPSISEEKELRKEFIISNLIRNKKKDLMGLAPPRWDSGIYHDNESHFQVPGPAYYAPKPQTIKKSFNLNSKDFIYTNSIPYQTVNGSLPIP